MKKYCFNDSVEQDRSIIYLNSGDKDHLGNNNNLEIFRGFKDKLYLVKLFTVDYELSGAFIFYDDKEKANVFISASNKVLLFVKEDDAGATVWVLSVSDIMEAVK